MEKMASIILFCLKKLNGERTIYSVFHLLNGKKSSQTIQDAHLFSLQAFFGVFETLTRNSYDNIISDLLKKNLIKIIGKQRFLLTSAGQDFLANNCLPSFINGYTYHRVTALFWERLSLFVQVASNLAFQERNYVPIQKNKEIHAWIKRVLAKIEIPRQEIGPLLYSELMECLEKEAGINPFAMVIRLTGFQQIGLTAEQAAKKLNLELYDYHIEFVNTIHFLISKIEENHKRCPVLAFVSIDFVKNNEITQSAKKTFELLNRGFSPKEIANHRHLKMSTIEDHLVELALHVSDFSIDEYVDKSLQEMIVQSSRESGTLQLKRIREKVQQANYFQIRLVLAKCGDRGWN